jgi:hypothetical protein
MHLQGRYHLRLTGNAIKQQGLSTKKSPSCLSYKDLWNLPVLSGFGILRS